jgi:tetratricopeptide (TPR) repeat protein
MLVVTQIQTEAALQYARQARDARPDDQQRGLLYARALHLIGRYDESREVYEALLQSPRPVPALVGLGELEMSVAQPLSAVERIVRLEKAVGYLGEARGGTPRRPIYVGVALVGTTQRDRRLELSGATDRVTFDWSQVQYLANLLSLAHKSYAS